MLSIEDILYKRFENVARPAFMVLRGLVKVQTLGSNETQSSTKKSRQIG